MMALRSALSLITPRFVSRNHARLRREGSLCTDNAAARLGLLEPGWRGAVGRPLMPPGRCNPSKHPWSTG
jgi:hypothetical protein